MASLLSRILTERKSETDIYPLQTPPLSAPLEICITLPQECQSEETSTAIIEDIDACTDKEDDKLDRDGRKDVACVVVTGQSGIEQWVVQTTDCEDSIDVKPEKISQDECGDLEFKPSNLTLLNLEQCCMQKHANIMETTNNIKTEYEAIEVKEEIMVEENIIETKSIDSRSTPSELRYALLNSEKIYLPHNVTETDTTCVDNSDISVGNDIPILCKSDQVLSDEWMSNNKCPNCDVDCENFMAFKEHYLYHLSMSNSDGLYTQCRECSATVLNTYLWKHVSIHSGPRKCEICGETFQYKTKYDAHIKQHRQQGHTYPCDVCKKVFSYAYLLKRHSVVHQDYTCDICGHSCSIKKDFDIHRRTHETKPRHECEKCGIWYKKMGSLLTHLTNVHSVSNPILTRTPVVFNKCERCNRKFQTVDYLKSHMERCKKKKKRKVSQKVESKRRPNYPCIDKSGEEESDCEKASPISRKLHKCEICCKTFVQKVTLYRHRTAVHGFDFECFKCKKVFKLEEDLSTHCMVTCTMGSDVSCTQVKQEVVDEVKVDEETSWTKSGRIKRRCCQKK